MEAVYKLSQDYGRAGTVFGIFVADTKEVKKIMGKQIYFGEILGKHSEVYFDIDEDNLKMISDQPEIINFFKENDIEVGYNPLEFYEEEEDTLVEEDDLFSGSEYHNEDIDD